MDLGPRGPDGRIVGTPGELTYAKDIHRYFDALDAASDRVKVWSIGKTEEGRDMVVLAVAERLLKEAENLKQSGREFANDASGSLTVATTHTQARYALPEVVQRFLAAYPHVRLSLRQGSPVQIAEQVVSGEADLAIATEAIEQYAELVMLPCYQWNRCVITAPDHPLLAHPRLSLEALAGYPIITYDFAFTGRTAINRAFESRNLSPNVVLTAIDADVIKTYVALGLGVGIVAKMAFDPSNDKNLRAIDASHLFEPSTTRIGVRRHTYLRGYTYDFIEFFAPHLTRRTVDAAMAGGGSDYEL